MRMLTLIIILTYIFRLIGIPYMPDTPLQKKQPSAKKLDISFGKKPEQPRHRYRHSIVPMSFYWLKDYAKEFISHKNFPDALAVVFATFSISIAFPLFPPIVLIPLLILFFAATIISPLGGLMLMLFGTLLMFIYQAPLLAWILTIFISVSLFLGHKHYRTITFIYALIMLPMSYLGFVFEIPAFVIGSLFIGYRRSMVSAIIILLMVAMLSGMTGIQNSAPIVYNAMRGSTDPFMVPSKPAVNLSDLPSAFAGAIGNFFSLQVASHIFSGFGAAMLSLVHEFQLTLIQIAVWLLVIFAMTSFVIRSRSALKGTVASTFSFAILAAYIILSYVNGGSPNTVDMLSFALTVSVVLFLELNNVEVVKALSVMKQDFLGRFGDAFQDLTNGSRETMADVINYDETKKELREAILAPIEHREIAGAYKVKPAKGLLLFGPPGTGKTLIMRSLANEVRAKFFYVKTSSLLSPYEGQSAKDLSKIFDMVRKSTPAILFFDEVDGIAAKREGTDSDASRQLISTLLAEMDGFQKIEKVVIVGSTNVPQLIDPGLLRPGRFDKIIYMPLPDKAGRAKMFQYYLSKLPIGKNINYQKLADITNRYSGADVKNACDEVARQVADEAVRERKVLEIDMPDIVNVIKSIKPSTSLSTLDKYNQFKIDFERRSHPEVDNKESEISLGDVVGLEEAKKALYEAIEIPILHPSLVKKYDVGNIKGILMFGPPGTGKTMLIRAVAAELEDVKLIVVSGSEIAKNGLENALVEIKDVFNRARENAPSIIFIDEMDALLPNRENSSEFAVHMTSEFLQQLDGIRSSNGIVLVGATNRPDHLDPAVLRPGRIDKFIFVPPPNSKARAQIFENYLKKAPIFPDMDFEKLAAKTDGFTGADIANICRQAKLNALEENVSTSSEKKISVADVLKIISYTKPSAPASILGVYMNFISIYGGR